MQPRVVVLIAIALGIGMVLFMPIAQRSTSSVMLKVDNVRPGWRLVFSDEFDAPRLDRSKWRTQYWYGRTNSPELQYYADDAFTFVDGTLHITAERRSANKMNYISGLISSQDHFTFTYGYAEIRAKVPSGKGLWPAFWLVTNGTIRRPEIDVLEVLGHDTRTIHTTLHYRDDDGAIQEDGHGALVPDLSADFHTFAVDWSSDAIIWFVDGIEVYRVTEYIPDEPMYLIANLAVGGAWPGNPDASTHFPATYAIDYIRVYQQ